MRLFDKRPLSLVLCIMLGGFVLFTRGNALFRALVIAAIPLILILFIISVIYKKKKTILLACCLGLCVSILHSQVYFGLWFNAARRFDGEVTVEAKVCEQVNKNSYSSSFSIKADNINGEPHTGYKLVLYLDTDTANSVQVGDFIKFRCKIENFKGEYASYNYAQSFSGRCIDVSELSVTDTGRFVPEAMFSHLRELISRYSKMLSDADSGSMLSALLLGERDMLSGQVRLDFRRLGITHLLALSGLHLAILSFGLEKLLKLLGARQNTRLIISIIFTFLYMALTGFPVSVKRAGIMLILSKILALLLRDSDSVTSLIFATTLISFTTPYAIYDISLWLSAFATLGVVIFSELSADEQNEKPKKKDFVHGILTSLTVSVFAITATLFISQFSFNGISLISPFATLIFSIFVEIILYLGSIMLIIGWIIPLGWLLSPIVKLTLVIASQASTLDVFVSKDYIVIDILVILLTVLFFMFILLDIKNKRMAIGVIIGLLTLVFVTSGTLNIFKRLDDKVVYFADNNQDLVLIKSDKEVSLINSARYSSSTGYTSIEALEKEKLHSIDKYIATHYSWKLSEDIDVMLCNVTVKEIYLPEPTNDSEKAILNKIYTVTEDYRTKICLANLQDKVAIGNYKLRFAYTTPYGEDTAQCVYMLYGDGRNLVYLSWGILNSSAKSKALEAIGQATDVIFGVNGKSYKNKLYFTAESQKAENLIVSSGRLIIPSKTAYYYIKNGCEIHSHPKEFVLAD